MSEAKPICVLKMNEDKTMEFISLYEKEPCLWNTNSYSFRNKIARANAASRIARTLKVPQFEAKHVMIKFKNLRNAYCQELRKLAASIDMGVDYRPKVIWFSKMDSFLRPHLSKTNVGQILDSNNIVIEEPESWRRSIKRVTVEAETQVELDYCSEDSSTVSDLLEPSIKQPQLETEDPLVSSDWPKDYYDDFGRYIASLLRTLPINKALALQPQIVNLITNAAIDIDIDES
ncbi:uncharacterized protein LOC106139614 [Amyelois transitella]|uniref:uncharacterized protein LOC106139614 n=1 Tax=Amyelois transitella TaxID=680683 RepID=UPI00067A8010|nr:uncharacterized protein LOC106139614 [Amyelois transitella]XP_013196549.1 uncharacterized protein LOC106139614 [Amyelois transitella]